MIRIPLPGDNNALLLTPRWGEVDGLWQVLLLAAVLAIPVVLAIWLFRYERLLVSRGAGAALLAVRVLILVVLLTIVCLQPVVARYSIEEQTGTIVIAVDHSRSMDVPDPQRTLVEKAQLAQLFGGRENTHTWTRAQIARELLAPSGFGLLDKLSARHAVEVLSFDRGVRTASASNPDGKPGGFERLFTDLAGPLQVAAERASRQSARVLGVVLLSDGQHNTGPAPVTNARDLGARGVPVYPVALGSRQPPTDISVREIKVPANTFLDSECLIEARIHVSGLPAGPIRVELHPRGQGLKPEFRQTLQHDGRDRVYPVRFQVRIEEVGTHAFELKAFSESKEVVEISAHNNSALAVTRIVRDKAKVLLVDGEPRWEYYYLSTLLARDREVDADRVVFQQPRLGPDKASPTTEPGLPASHLPEATKGKGDPLLEYECIILGDVTPAELPWKDRVRLEQYVSQSGGTLVLVAGKRGLPFAFIEGQNEPFVKLFPLLDSRAIASEKGFKLQLTAEGETAPFLQIDAAASGNARRWPELQSHFWGISGALKPGARVLARSVSQDKLADGEPLIVEQNYGFGRVLWLGIDSTWRWRFRVGDTYHHRFWGQLIRWAAADKLLPAGNRHVRFGPREPIYHEGKEVHVGVRLSHELTPPKGKAIARIHRKQPDGKETAIAEVSLVANPLQPHRLEGRIGDLSSGEYRIELDIPELKDTIAELPEETAQRSAGDTFAVTLPETQELADLSTNWTLLETLATQSKGELFTPETAYKLIDLFESRISRVEHRADEKLWQDSPIVWLMLGTLLLLLTVEWVVRKLTGLP